VDSGSQVFTSKGGPDPIFDLGFNKAEGSTQLWSCGVKHFASWSLDGKKQKGIFGSNPMCSFACLATDDQGNCFAGGSNALIYVWTGTNVKQTLGVHGDGFVGAIIWQNGKLYSGGKDGRVVVTDTSTFEVISAFEFGVLPRAIDVFNDQFIIVGLRNGSIVECDMSS